MNGWVLGTGLAVLALVAACMYAAGREAGLGRGEQDRAGLAERIVKLEGWLLAADRQVIAQHNRIRAMTAWELLPWPSGATSPAPERPVSGRDLSPHEARVPRQRRPKRTSTAAFLNPELSEPAAVELPPFDIRDLSPLDPPPSTMPPATPERTPAWAEWPSIEDQIWQAKLWLAGL